VARDDDSICFLFDNGSLRAASTLSLRAIARRLETRIDTPVRPVSLLHSSGVPAEALAGRPAELLEPALREFGRQGGRRAVLLPLFFGPSRALTEYLPERLAVLQAEWPQLRIETAEPLVGDRDDSVELLAAELRVQVNRTTAQAGWRQPAVIVVDHGSPEPGVTAVRDRLGQQLRAMLAREARAVGVASMERRSGPEYDFNEPLLERALATPPFNHGEVVVALQFLQPGRHAGAGGDIAQIVEAARKARPNISIAVTEPLGGAETVLQLLERRWRAVTA